MNGRNPHKNEALKRELERHHAAPPQPQEKQPMFPITITIHNDAQLNAVLAAMKGNAEPVQPVKEPAAKKSTPVSTTTTATPAAASSPSATAGATAADAAKPLDYDKDIKPLVLKLGAMPEPKGGRAAILAIVGKFNKGDGEPATNAREVLPTDHPALKAALDAAIAA